MKHTSPQDPHNLIMTLNMNGLNGRMIHIRTKRQFTKEILVVYGNHSSIEDWFPALERLQKYGNVTMPDLPGFGGMQSLFRIGEKPTIDNLADYLASFIKLRYKRKKITILAADSGFIITTRMLQHYPDIARKVQLLIGVNGFSRYDDLNIPKSRRRLIRLIGRLASPVGFSWIIKEILINQTSIRQLHQKKTDKLLLNQVTSSGFKNSFGDDLRLWRLNDFRTHAFITRSLLSVDNCQTTLDVDTWNYILNSHYFKLHNLKQHLRVTYSNINIINPKSRKQIDGIDKAMLDDILSAKMKRLLSRPG
jgi:pimeloyl-ACP methyl ester carboxylesterase